MHKFGHVSAACRVPLAGELELLRSIERPTQRLLHRATLVQAVLAISSAGAESGLDAGFLMPAPPPSASEACIVGPFFDLHRRHKSGAQSDGFAYQEKTWADWLQEKGWHLYNPPPSGVGLPALAHFSRVLGGALSLNSHFLLLYELLTGSLDVRPLSTDSAYNWGAMLVWMLPPADGSSEGLFMETLRVLVRSPHLCRRAPRYERERKDEQLSLFQQVRNYLLGGGDAQDSFLGGMRALQLQEHTVDDDAEGDERTKASTLTKGSSSAMAIGQRLLQSRQQKPSRRDLHVKGYEPPALLPVPELRSLWVATGEDFRRETVQLRVLNHLEKALRMPEIELEALTGCLLELTAGRTIAHVTRAERGLSHLPSALPFDVRKHPLSGTRVAQHTLERLAEDVVSARPPSNTEPRHGGAICSYMPNAPYFPRPEFGRPSSRDSRIAARCRVSRG